jgi:hypothetical protein
MSRRALRTGAILVPTVAVREQRGATVEDQRAGPAGGMRVPTAQQPPARIGERRARAYVA